MTGEEMYSSYREAARMRAIELPIWTSLNLIQREIWNEMGEGFDAPETSDE